MSLFKRLTTYHRVPGQTDPKIFIHIDSRSARRQFGSHRLGALEDERGEVDQTEFIPESDEAVLPDDEHLRWRGPEALEAEVIRRTKKKYDPRFITEEEEAAAIDSPIEGALDIFEHKLQKVERATKRKDKASTIRRLARIATCHHRSRRGSSAAHLCGGCGSGGGSGRGEHSIEAERKRFENSLQAERVYQL
jgi:hypothetical protein